MRPLPRLMVAPNGARLTRADHPALPVTIPQIVACAQACRSAGADGLHAHIRGRDSAHSLDAGLYKELLQECALALPEFYVQITTESAGKYTPQTQRDLVLKLRPPAISVAVREITADGDAAANRALFSFCCDAGTDVQFILYDENDIDLLLGLIGDRILLPQSFAVLLVLGRYTTGPIATPDTLTPFVRRLRAALPDIDWAVCAFGPNETECLLEAHRSGGKCRIGFENNNINADGSQAVDNAARVADFRVWTH